MITTLASNIEDIISGHALGYQALDYALDIDKNVKHKRSKRFGVRILDGNETGGVLGRHTINQSVEVVLVDDFKEPANDIQSRLKANTLYDDLLTLSDFLARVKCNTAGVLNCTLISVSEPTYLDQSNTVFRTATLNILFRI